MYVDGFDVPVLLRTSHPERYTSRATIISQAPAISLDDLLEMLDAQLMAFKEASHAVKSGVSADKVSKALRNSVSLYVRNVGIGVSPVDMVFFREPNGSIFVLDPMMRIPANNTPDNELVLLFVDGMQLAMAGVFWNSSPLLNLAIKYRDDTRSVTAVWRVEVAFHAKVTAFGPAASSTQLTISLPIELPEQPDGPITLIELPCAWVLLFQQKGRAAAFVLATSDVCCKLSMEMYDSEGVYLVMSVAINRVGCKVTCSRIPVGQVRNVTARFLPYLDNTIMMIPCIGLHTME